MVLDLKRVQFSGNEFKYIKVIAGRRIVHSQVDFGSLHASS